MKRMLYIALMLLVLLGCQKDELGDLEETFYVRTDGASMPVYVRGNGSSGTFLLIVHGGPGGYGLQYRNKYSSDPLEEELAVAYWDQRGQGMAQGSYSKDFLNQATMAEDLRKVILTLKERYGQSIDVYLLGHSWGGCVGTAFLLYPGNQQLIKGWIEVDGAHDYPMIYRSAVKRFNEIGSWQRALGNDTEWWNETLDILNDIDTNTFDVDDFIEMNQRAFDAENKMLLNGSLSSPSELRLPNLYGPTNLLISNVTGRLTNGMLSEETHQTSYTKRLHEITVPTCIIWGEYDLVVPIRLGRTAFERISSTQKYFVVMPGSGHSPMSNEPNAYVNAVLDFIQKTQ